MVFGTTSKAAAGKWSCIFRIISPGLPPVPLLDVARLTVAAHSPGPLTARVTALVAWLSVSGCLHGSSCGGGVLFLSSDVESQLLV